MLTIVLHATLTTLAIFTGVTLGLLILAATAYAVHHTWTATRYSRPGWWLHRHRPTVRTKP